MGWSCTRAAGDVLERWEEICRKQTETQNEFLVGSQRYFWEKSSTEHSDGAITGTIWKYVSDTRVRRSGTFRIEGSGQITRAPSCLKGKT